MDLEIWLVSYCGFEARYGVFETSLECFGPTHIENSILDEEVLCYDYWK